jgi:hypothetical protein
MRRSKTIPQAGRALAAAALAAALAPAAQAGSIQQPGLTTGLAEGYGLTEGFYGVSLFNIGSRTTTPDETRSITTIPMFFTWATPYEIADARVLVKAAPLVHVDVSSGPFNASSLYSPYAGVWFSWYLGGGYNLAIGEGAQFNVNKSVEKLTGRDYNAFQQNVALSYVKDNWNITGNAFFTQGRTNDTASQPRTANLDFTAIKRDGREEYGLVAFGEWDLNRPATGYGQRQREIAVGVLAGYIVGNQIAVQAKVTTDLQEKYLGGRETRLWVNVIIPLQTPPAPAPANSPFARPPRT